MSPSDKNKPQSNSKSTEGKPQKCSEVYSMDSQLESVSSSDVTKPGHGIIPNIPLITASQPTLKCSINDQMKTFDPGENSGIERLTSNHCEKTLFQSKNSSSLKNNKNYKAGSKINKLADMLAKRSQNVVEVTQNNTSDLISGITCGSRADDTITANDVGDPIHFESNMNSNVVCLKKTAVGKDMDSLKKSRRKSVPNDSCNIHQLQSQSVSKSCLDFIKLFSLEENNMHELNALGGSLSKLPTDESTKKKPIRKNLKNVELSLILPEKKRRSSMRTENVVCSKVSEKNVHNTLATVEGKQNILECYKEVIPSSVTSSLHNVSSTKARKENKIKQRRSKRLVETSTQTADIEFISVVKSKPEVADTKLTTEEIAKSTITYECLYCTQTFALGSQCKAHEKTHSQKNNKLFIKCQYCYKKLSSLVELKLHCIKKHPNKYSNCLKCNEIFMTKDELNVHYKEIHCNKYQNNCGQDYIDEFQQNTFQEKKKEGSEEKQTDKKMAKQNGVKTDLKIDVSYESLKKSSVSPRNIQKSPKDNKTEEQLLEMEMLFYSNLSGNIQENLNHHLDGKLDKSGNPVRADQIKDSSDSVLIKSNSLLSVDAPSVGAPDIQISRAPSPYQTRSKTPNPLPPTAKKFKKLPNWQQKFWEKYNFPTNYRYEHKFWDKNYLNTEKSAFYLKDLSCLDIKTQLTMRENIKKLDNIKILEENSKSIDNLKFPEYLSLVPRVTSDYNQETTASSQEINLPEASKPKAQTRKEKVETKKSFKSPMSEILVMKTRGKSSMENSPPTKKSEKSNVEKIKMITRRQSSIDLNIGKEDSSRKRKGSLDSSGSQRMTLRRQTSLDNIQGSVNAKVDNNESILELSINKFEVENTPMSPIGAAEISGEWVRPRSYLCGTCCAKFTNLWELEDHKWVSHPNVWCTHYEFEDEKIDKLFQKPEDEVNEVNSGDTLIQSNLKLTDLYKRYLLPYGSLKTAKLVPNTTFPEQCTKCKKSCMNSSEMHKHMLDCGGDTTWFLTMYSSPMTIKRKWRPFGSRRRKQISRRELKRSIPSAPNLRSYHYQHRIRTKPGDVETIQKMLANLPEKRARRAINFDEIKTRSQTTIHSNRLLRKRFKTSFTTNFLNLKSIRRNCQLKQNKKENSSKSATDASSESTPIGSPKRKNKLKDNTVVKRENLFEGLADKGEKCKEKKVNKNELETTVNKEELEKGKNKTAKLNKQKPKTKELQVNLKPITRSNSVTSGTNIHVTKSKRSTLTVKEENNKSISLDFSENITEELTDNKKMKEISKTNKKLKLIKPNKTNNKINKIKQEDGLTNPQVSKSVLEISEKKTQKLPKNLEKKKLKVKVNGSRSDENSFSSSKKKKDEGRVIKSGRILRIRQSCKEKNELIKRIKKKFKSSKRILDLKNIKKVGCGSRRSQRIKSLQMSEEPLEISEEKELEHKTEGNKLLKKDIKLKKSIVSLEEMKNDAKVVNEKLIKEKMSELKESVSLAENVRLEKRCSRPLRNSVSSEEKQDPNNIFGDKIENLKNVSLSQRNFKTGVVSVEPPVTIMPNLIKAVKKHKKAYRIQNFRILRRGNPHNTTPSGQVSLLKKNRLQDIPVTHLGGSSETTNSKENPKSNDLAEMPILAKVEPIHGKTYLKNESEIPVLMPIEKELDKNNQSKQEEPVTAKGVISFQVVKNKKKTSKEITPLKIVKKIENGPAENAKVFSESFPINKNDNFNSENCFLGKNRKRKSPVISLEKRIDMDEKRNKNSDLKKYFLGICPNEIDKGRIDVLDDSGSDSEPLISLINNQKEKTTKPHCDNSISELNGCQDCKEESKNHNTLISDAKETNTNNNKQKLHQIVESSFIPSDILSAPNKENGKVESEMVSPGKIDVEECEIKKNITAKNSKVSKIRKMKNSGRTIKRLRMTVTLKEPTLKIIDKSPSLPVESKWTVKVPEEVAVLPDKIQSVDKSSQGNFIEMESSLDTSKENLPERRSRRISKENKVSNEFVIDDPLILVDELWSDLDSDSDCSKKKNKKGKKKTFKKKTSDDKRISDIKLEELLRNFGENKEIENSQRSQELVNSSTIKVIYRKCSKTFRSLSNIRELLENRQKQESNKRLSLKLFRFRKLFRNFGNRGEKLSDVKKALKKKQDEIEAKCGILPDLPFLATEIKENPLQVIQCRAQKTKITKKGQKKLEAKNQNSKINFKISLPLESINNVALFNNNHLTELVIEENGDQPKVDQVNSQTVTENECNDHSEVLIQKQNQVCQEVIESLSTCELKSKPKRSEVIDKIFYCEICKTYYYSSSQLKIHKLSNRHKLKESELAKGQVEDVEKVESIEEMTSIEKKQKDSCDIPLPIVENNLCETSTNDEVEAERQNDDTLEMPTLEGPFIENPLTREEAVGSASTLPPVNTFGFSQESLKDIQQAIGCTDEEMLILTLLGENTIEIENDILDLESCKPDQTKVVNDKIEKMADSAVSDKANGSLKVDLKQRMTSALACLVNKAVFNLLQKYESTTKTAVNSEALSFLGKLSSLSRRKNILQLKDLLKKQDDGELAISTCPKDLDKKESTVPYKYQCTICGSRFEKASTRECHISRSHRGKAKKAMEDIHSGTENEWNDWSYDNIEDHLGNINSSQFWCSDCGINFLSPQEVFEHQKLEHQPGIKDTERNPDTGPLQSCTIGSSDEIVEGKKPRRRTKVFSSEELDQQRIIANNELRKLDRKFACKNKASKIKWGMDALKFTVEKENKIIVTENETTIMPEDISKPQGDSKTIDLIPKLNLSRTRNIPEFKIVQKTSLKNRFQKIMDNKMKRRTTRHSHQEPQTDDLETEVMLVPVVMRKKNKKQKSIKYVSRKDDSEKVLDVYDFNESESENEPMVFSHIKKTVNSPPKLKFIKMKEGPSKNKADSTTKDLSPDDYDSEDSLPLSFVKKPKPEEDNDNGEKISGGIEKSEGILEQVEYLIEQLENETGPVKKNKVVEEDMNKKENDLTQEKEKNVLYAKEDTTTDLDSVYSLQETFQVSVANKFLELKNTSLVNQNDFNKNEKSCIQDREERIEGVLEPEESIFVEPESSQSIFDEEDSIPLVLISKKAELTKISGEKKCDENATDLSMSASEDVQRFEEEYKSNDMSTYPRDSEPSTKQDSLPLLSFNEIESSVDEKVDNSFEPLNENISSQNESLSELTSDSSNDGLIHSNFENGNIKNNETNFDEEITEKKDVVIICSRGVEGKSNKSKESRKRLRSVEGRKKKRFPLLTATIEEDNFKKIDNSRPNKEVIVKKIWNRRKLIEADSENEEDSFFSVDHNSSIENIQNDESQTEIEKEIIVKKIWSRKKLEHEGEFIEKHDDKFKNMKINQTEVSDEVIIKCGPKTKPNIKRRKSKSTNESSKETIMRKIWSGKCFQTKAALKTYDSDVLSICKENNITGEQNKPKKRGRPSGITSVKRSKAEVDNDEDDLDSLLEEIEREELEKAIRLEFLHMRRSEKNNGETMKDSPTPSVGLFTETNVKHSKNVSDRRRKKVRKKMKHPRQSVLKRRKFMKKPIRRVLQADERPLNECNSCTNAEQKTDQCENTLEKNIDSFDVGTKIKNRKHKKHRHKHHHHKHKHKKSKHHKNIVNKHKSKYKFEDVEETLEKGESFSILEKICKDIPNQIENEWEFKSKTSKKVPCLSSNDKTTDGSLFFENEVKDYSNIGLDFSGKNSFESENGNIYEFVEDISNFSVKNN